jgi:NodT family efflux transporter outer membrane factor (OMF) lipoprotein
MRVASIGAIVVCAALACLAAACAPKVAYQPPSAQPVAEFRESANWKSAQPRDVDVRGAWWDAFNDPLLTRLEARVDVSNQTLRAADAQFAQARALVRGARANRAPQVIGAPSVSSVRPSGNRGFTSFHDPYADLVAPIDVSYEADVWGRLRGIVEASRTSAQATAADLETARLSLHAELAIDYLTLRGLDRERQILTSAVDAFTQALELTQNRFRGGLASAADVAQAETQLETTRAQAVDVGVQRAALEHAIAVLVGEPASTFTVPASPLDVAPPDVPIGLPSDLLERRSDIASAERRIASASAQVGVAQAAFYPLLTLTGAAGFESSSFGTWLAAASHFWAVGPAAAINVFDAGRRRATTEQARAAYDVASASYQETVLGAFREVEDQLAALRVLEEEAAIQDRAVAASERALALANNRYRGGVTSYLEVITAQSAALANERAAVAILMRRMSATVLLIKGLGGDWSTAKLPVIAGSEPGC